MIVSEEINGWKSLEFTLPRWIDLDGGRAENPYMAYVKNEFLVRYQEDDCTDWFLITLPTDDHESSNTVTVSCGHISSLLNRKKLYLIMDDTNGIGTAEQIAALILQNTGWTLGACDTFLEADGQTEKVRSLKSDGKEGAYQLLSNLCNLFHARPVYHGDTRTVDILAISNRDAMLEFTYEKNMKSVRVEHNTESLVTRLYVEGIFDELGYIGIEDVNPTGLGFLLNFDYFRSIGLFTDTHELAVTRYLEDMRTINARIMAKSREISEAKTSLNTLWGQCQYIVWEPQSQPSGSEIRIATPATNTAEVTLNVGDAVVVCLASGSFVRTKVVSYVEMSKITVADAAPGARYVIRFKTPSAGLIAGKEVTIAAKESTIETLEKKLAQTTDERAKQTIREQITLTRSEIQTLYHGNSTTPGLYIQMGDAAALAVKVAKLMLEF